MLIGVVASGGMAWEASLWLGSRSRGVKVVLSWVGCSVSRVFALVSAGAGGICTGDPFVKFEAEVSTFGAWRFGRLGEWVQICYMTQAAAGFWDTMQQKWLSTVELPFDLS